MGIPKFFKWFRNQESFNLAISKSVPSSVDIFAIDMNALIYEHLKVLDITVIKQEGIMYIQQGELYRRRYEVFRKVFENVIGLTRTIKPRRSLVLAFDGVPPQAKINQQRARRYKAASEREQDEVFDKNSLTPGTDFMRELDAYIREQFERISQLDAANESMRDPDARALPPHIVYSSHLVPGEGEHKIADHLRKVDANGQTAVVHGMDADLIMIYLMRLKDGWDNIYLFRENNLNYGVQTMIDLNSVERILKTMYAGVPDPVGDFVSLIFLIGNDFLPHFPTFELILDALNTLVAGYAVYIKENDTEGITTGSGINWSEMANFMQYINDNYGDILLKRWGENLEAQIKFPSAVAQKCITQTQQIIGTTSRCVRTLDVEQFKSEWYPYVFSSKIGLGQIEPTQEDINALIQSYLEGMAWIYNYYQYGVSSVNVGWYYINHYSPLFSDLHTYIQSAEIVSWETNPLHVHSEFLTPMEQLVMVLPPKSISSVPVPLQTLYTESSPIFDLMPESFLIDVYGKMEEWQAIALVPIPEPRRVVRAVNMLGLPEEFKARFAPQEIYTLIRDITSTLQRPTRGRGRGTSRGSTRGRGRGTRGRGRGSTRGRGRGSTATGSRVPIEETLEYKRTFI